jgi:hypothetical protein
LVRERNGTRRGQDTGQPERLPPTKVARLVHDKPPNKRLLAAKQALLGARSPRNRFASGYSTHSACSGCTVREG